jgi:hypothetical protein
MGCDAHLLFSFECEKDRTLPNLMFMLFLIILSYFISLYESFWVYHSSIYLEGVFPGVASNASKYCLCISFLLDFL